MGYTIAGHEYNYVRTIYYIRPMAHGHSLTRYLYFILFYFMYTYNLTKINEISFNTHLLVIAYYVYICTL